jgi:hypothetical protein
MGERPDDIKTINMIVDEIHRRLQRMDGRDGAVATTVDRARSFELEDKRRSVEINAMQAERAFIESALVHGKITRDTARRMRDNVALMELDIEDQIS